MKQQRLVVSEQMRLDLAVVEVTDECRVELRLLRKRTDFSPAQAVQLADALMRAAAQAQSFIEEQIAALQERMSHGEEAL